MRILQINTTLNSGSHGRMANDIGQLLIRKGHESYIAYGRTSNYSESHPLKVGKKHDIFSHVLISRLFDRHGFGSVHATEDVIAKIDTIGPDLIHLHNLHGYYLNIKVLFKYLKYKGLPVIWTLHDCWPFTGHCSHFQRIDCDKWKAGCYKCPLTHCYPKSWFVDNSRKNFREKKELFNSLKKIVLVSPSLWLYGHLENSFLSGYEIKVINNGTNTDKFKPVDCHQTTNKYNLTEKYIFGIANVWTETKGLGDFISLRKILDPDILIVLAGLAEDQAKTLPTGIRGIPRTENIEELAALYSGAIAFVNPTYVDNFPSVNIEALACGTPVITYDTGGSPEAIDQNTGIVVEKGSIIKINMAIVEISSSHHNFTQDQCRSRVIKNFSTEERLADYLNLYEKVLSI